MRKTYFSFSYTTRLLKPNMFYKDKFTDIDYIMMVATNRSGNGRYSCDYVVADPGGAQQARSPPPKKKIRMLQNKFQIAGESINTLKLLWLLSGSWNPTADPQGGFAPVM